jgi:hypothetical protein
MPHQLELSSSTPLARSTLFAACIALGCASSPHSRTPSADERAPLRQQASAPVAELVENGVARAAIYVEPEIFADALPARGRQSAEEKEQAKLRERLRASIEDLQAYVRKISGADLPIVAAAPDSARVAILVGKLAERHFGPLPVRAPGGQGYRFVVSPRAIGVYGESDLGTSYAIYELLDRLGCRWFMPGELGEVVPREYSIALAPLDVARAPSTVYRNLWYVDETFRRRNRLGGVVLNAGHALEKWVSSQQRLEHPEWRAVINGKPSDTRLRWSRVDVAEAIATSIDESVERRASPSVSLSPLDGDEFDESEDRALDAGDYDPATGRISLTDRLLVLVNRVANQLSSKRPNLLFGLYAYASYARAPVREAVQPSIVPVIAPITYCRSHALTDDRCPGARELRDGMQGWAKKAQVLGYRPYLYNLAEPSAPNPMIRKWSAELPWILAHGVKFWQPETLPNFETSLPALWLAMRLPWDDRQEPSRVLDELYSRFYGAAAREVRAYYELVDRAWAETPEFSGNNLGYVRRFSPAWLAGAEQALAAARAACKTDLERSRVALLDESLQQFELYLQMLGDLARGRFETLQGDASRWLARAQLLAEKHRDSAAFAARTAKQPATLYTVYFRRFMLPIYEQATRIAREGAFLTAEPACRWQFAPAESTPEQLASVTHPRAAEPAWKTTDACTETWSSLGLHEYFGAVWYSATLELAASPAKKRAFAWIARADGMVRLFIDGNPTRAVGASGATAVEATLGPVAFDITPFVQKTARVHQLAVVVQRTKLRELGGGGLLGPVILYRQK